MGRVIFEQHGQLHLQVRDRIVNMILQKGLRGGDPLPTYRDLSRTLNVSLVTVQRAMKELSREGLVAGHPGRGTVVARDVSGEGRRLTQIGLVFFCSKQLLFGSAYLMDLFRGLMLAADARGADVRIVSIKSEGSLSPKQIASAGVDGVVLCAVANDAYLRQFDAEGIPTVAVDTFNADVKLDYAVADNAAALRQTVDHLVRLGHRRIAYIDGWSTDTVAGSGASRDPVIDSSDAQERRGGFFAAMGSHGLLDEATVYPVHVPAPQETVPRAVDAWLDSNPRPTAVIGYDAGYAQPFADALEEFGLRMPEDVSFAGAVAAGTALLDGRVITTNKIDFVNLGRQAVALLELRHREGRSLPPQVYRGAPEFVAGQTVGPVLGEGRS
ncbi:MAG: GntR family transcriptional regulator [Planctomycetes bacterium]|nr:GntR family transcriptional regulator [Planctomycetota bacterium]